tara:strand:- start:1033 stop:1296 length:264 start_codon:yes stop_codon:yes gene_type:complete
VVFLASFLAPFAGVLLADLAGFLAASFFAPFFAAGLSFPSLALDLDLSLSLESAAFFGYLASLAFLVALYVTMASLYRFLSSLHDFS